MDYHVKEPRFVSLKEAGAQGRRDTAKGGPWIYSWDMTREEWDAYCTGLHRQAYPGSSNRRMRKYVNELFKAPDPFIKPSER